MKTALRNDLRAIALGIGGALIAYYGYVLYLLLSGRPDLNTPGTWLGLAAGMAVIQWALSSGPMTELSNATT